MFHFELSVRRFFLCAFFEDFAFLVGWFSTCRKIRWDAIIFVLTEVVTNIVIYRFSQVFLQCWCALLGYANPIRSCGGFCVYTYAFLRTEVFKSGFYRDELGNKFAYYTGNLTYAICEFFQMVLSFIL